MTVRYYSGDRSTSHARERRAAKTSYDPLQTRAKMVSDSIWERANTLAELLAPDVPSDAEALTDFESWKVLETAARSLSPAMWDDPDALTDLYRLRKTFSPGLATEELQMVAARAKALAKNVPDPAITPASSEFERQLARMKR